MVPVGKGLGMPGMGEKSHSCLDEALQNFRSTPVSSLIALLGGALVAA